MSLSFYTTLSSNMQRTESPDNGPSGFKARLPKDQVWHNDDRWEVGLSGVLIPHTTAAPVHPKTSLHILGPVPSEIRMPINTFVCIRLNPMTSKGPGAKAKDLTPSSTGVELAKKITNLVKKSILNTLMEPKKGFTTELSTENFGPLL